MMHDTRRASRFARRSLFAAARPDRRRPLAGAAAVALLLAAALLAALALGGCRDKSAGDGPYHCPMHPTYVADRPGDCPICGMRLVPVAGDKSAGSPAPGDGMAGGGTMVGGGAAPVDSAAQAGSAARAGNAARAGIAAAAGGSAAPAAAATGSVPPHPEKWTCVMCPEVQADAPGRCPVCGMRLQAPSGSAPAASVTATPAVPGAQAAPGASAAARPAAPPSGLASIEPGAAALRLAGARTAPAVRAPLARVVRAAGRVTADERRVSAFQARAGGWVERLHVSFTGERVRAGQAVLDLYAPELLAGQEEYLRARESAARFAASDQPEVRRGGEDLLRAARRRLELLGVPPAAIDELDRGGRPRDTVTLTAPASGHVTGKAVVAGQRVEPGETLFTVSDLDAVWVTADLYESEASLAAVGREAVITLPYDPDVRLEARVAFVAPVVDPQARTVQVRLDAPNPGLKLRPGMLADVELRADLGVQLVVPDDAVMDTGERQYVFVAQGKDGFAPRAVRVGVRANGRAQILVGLAEGERVAVAANFLLDSESRLRAALAGWSAPAAGHESAAGTTTGDHAGHRP